jgi:exosortase sorting signal-containing protein
MKKLCLLLSLLALPAAAQTADTVTAGTVSAAAGSTVDVPVFIRDVSGSPLGIDQPPGSRIQSYGLTVNYAPAASVQSITFARGGITAPLTPAFESSPSSAGTISLLDAFQESTNLIPFTLNAPAPGNQVAVLHVTVAPTATVGSTITLTLDPTLTQLTDQGGSAATKESVGNANLVLVSGAINVTTPVPALSGWGLALLAISLATIAVAATHFKPD